MSIAGGAVGGTPAGPSGSGRSGRERAVGRPPATPVTVLIAETNPLVRAGMRAALEHGGMRVVAEACGVASLAQAVHREAPQVVVAAVALATAVRPGSALSRSGRGLAVIAGELESGELLALLRAEVRAIVHRDDPLEDLRRAVAAVAAGQAFISPAFTGWVIDAAVRGDLCLPARAPVLSGLTPREREVAECVARGLTNREIGSTLHITEKTVKFHVSHVLEKSGARNRCRLIALLAGRP